MHIAEQFSKKKPKYSDWNRTFVVLATEEDIIMMQSSLANALNFVGSEDFKYNISISNEESLNLLHSIREVRRELKR